MDDPGSISIEFATGRPASGRPEDWVGPLPEDVSPPCPPGSTSPSTAREESGADHAPGFVSSPSGSFPLAMICSDRETSRMAPIVADIGDAGLAPVAIADMAGVSRARGCWSIRAASDLPIEPIWAFAESMRVPIRFSEASGSLTLLGKMPREFGPVTPGTSSPG